MGFGVGVNRIVPSQWQGYKWTGLATPSDTLVRRLLEDIGNGCVLPTVDSLAIGQSSRPRRQRLYIDLLSDERLAAILHADDPIFLSSTAGDLQAMCNVISDWAVRHRASFHVTSRKSVVIPMLAPGIDTGPALAVPVFLTTESQGRQQRHKLTMSLSHRWLGMLWSACLDFAPELNNRLALADKNATEIILLVESRALPLDMAIEIFESKVDGLLAYGRWLTGACVDEAPLQYDTYYARWALRLLGAPPWRRAAIAQSELGWGLTGFARAVRDVALKLARLQRQSELDVYASSARDAADVSGSWYARANDILVRLGLPQPVLTCASSDAEYHGYKCQVTTSLKLISVKSHEASIALSSATLPYQYLQAECPSQILAECRTVTLGWQAQIAVRSWIRLRAGYIELASRGESRSAARIRTCIFCSGPSRNSVVHVLGRCGHWVGKRASFLRAAGFSADAQAEKIAVAILTQRPSEEGFEPAVMLCAEVDRVAADFWARCRAE